MGKIVHSRLDDESHAMLAALAKRLDWSESKIIREGIRLVATTTLSPKKRKRIVGLGKFCSSVKDLGSNKAHLSGFGKSSLGSPSPFRKGERSSK